MVSIETTDQAVILKKLDENNLYKEIKKLILNNKKRKQIQINSRKNVKHIIASNTKIIDKYVKVFFLNIINHSKK